MNNIPYKITKTARLLRIASLCLLISLQSGLSVNLESDSNEASASSQTASIETIPEWFEKKVSVEMQGTGKWIADNSKYKSEQEPADAYGIEYSWGTGKKSIKFRLFAVTDQKESGTIWEYREFWHPGEKKVLVYQWGGDGTFGYGEVKPVESYSGKFELEQIFFDPSGTSWKSKHESLETENGRLTKSFDFDNGVWKENRTYLWKLKK